MSRTSFLTLSKIATDFLLPPICSLCMSRGGYICRNCQKLLAQAKYKCIVCSRKNPLGLTCPKCLKKYDPNLARACFEYSGKTKQLIKEFKYNDLTCLKHFFAGELAKLVSSLDNYQDYSIQPIPLTRRKKMNRGYNQSELLGKIVSQKLKIPLSDSLARDEASGSQALSETKNDRMRNVRGVFKLRGRPAEMVLLLDDVITSGATMREATRMLKRKGTRKVICISVAM